jgi:hypothetical protein
MGSERRLFAGALAASMLLATVARAQPTAVDREMARSLMDQGYDLKKKGDLKEALKRFKAADDIMHVPTTALPLAQVQAELGLLVEARDTLAASLRRTPEKPSDPQPFKVARAEGEKLDASLAPRVPSLTISLENLPKGDTPTLDVDGADVPADALGLPRPVDPGHHVVTVKSKHSQGKTEVDVKEAEQKTVQVALTLIPEAPPEQQPPSAAEQPEAPPRPVTSHSPTVLTWVGVGIGGAGLATGVATGILSLSKKSAVQNECTNDICGPGQPQSDLHAWSTMALVSTIGFAAAGAGAALAVITLVVGHEERAGEPAATPPESASPPAESGLVLRPWVGPGSAGLAGTF